MSHSASIALAPPPCPALTLRPYQEECVKRVLAAYEQDRHGQELLVLPTAAGKTVIFSQIIHELSERHGLTALIVAHTDELLNQAAEKYRQVKPTAVIGKVGGGIHDYGGEVTVASVDTISRPNHLARLQRIGYGLVVVDEAHRSAAPKYQRVLQALPHAFVLKVTATPDRLDGKPISKKPALYSTDILAMIEQGYLCDVKAIAIRTEISLDHLHTEGGDYREQELEAAIDTPARNRRVVEAYREHAVGRRAICFAVTIQHAVNLTSAFNAQGIRAATVSGETPLKERKRLYHALRTGEVNVLCNVLVLTEGFDLPLVDCVIMARPTQSRALFIQCLGRGLRLAPIKRDCVILDLTDNCLKHRLEPQDLSKVLGKRVRDGETVLSAIKREEEEQHERVPSGAALVRRLKDRGAVTSPSISQPDWTGTNATMAPMCWRSASKSTASSCCRERQVRRATRSGLNSRPASLGNAGLQTHHSAGRRNTPSGRRGCSPPTSTRWCWWTAMPGGAAFRSIPGASRPPG